MKPVSIEDLNKRLLQIRDQIDTALKMNESVSLLIRKDNGPVIERRVKKEKEVKPKRIAAKVGDIAPTKKVYARMISTALTKITKTGQEFTINDILPKARKLLWRNVESKWHYHRLYDALKRDKDMFERIKKDKQVFFKRLQ